MTKPTFFKSDGDVGHLAANKVAEPTILDWGVVESSIKSFSKQNAIPDRSMAFALMTLERLTGESASELKSCLTDGGNDRGVDAVHIDHTRHVVRIFQFKQYRHFEKSRNNFPGLEVDKLLGFLDDFLTKRLTKSGCNALLYQKCCELWSIIDEGLVAPLTFEVTLVTNGRKLHEPDKQRFERAISKYGEITVRQHDLQELARSFCSRRPSNQTRKLRFVEGQFFDRSDRNARGMLGTVKATDLVEFLRADNDPTQIDQSLFQENFRLYLGADTNRVNERIRQSAISPNSIDFWYLNNGITIVCSQIKYQPGYPGPITLVGAQVVNGCQTANAIFEALQLSPDTVPYASISVKVIETTDDTFVDRIAEATNSQTPIRGRDLRANDLVQIKIEQSLLALGLFYERKRNQHIDKPASKRIDALKAGQVLLAYFNGEPDKAKTQSNEIFGELFEQVFMPHRVDGDSVYAAYSLFTMLEKRRDIAQKNMKAIDGHDYQEAWIVEGIFHLLMVIGLLCERDGIPLSNLSGAERLIDEGIDIISKFVAEMHGVAAYRLFRLVTTKQKLKERVSPRQLRLAI